jgi:hypothetical protein
VKKGNYCNRFAPLRFESLGLGENFAAEEEKEDDHELDQSQNQTNMDRNSIKFGNLAISEFDEEVVTADEKGLSGVLDMMNTEGIKRLKKIVRFQVLEKHWQTSAASITTLLLMEYHQSVLIAGKDELIISKGENGTITNTIPHAGELAPLIPTVISLKKHLRKLMLQEFSKEYKEVALEDITSFQRQCLTRGLKDKVLDFYALNFQHIVMEEVERAEFCHLMMDFRGKLNNTRYGNLIFSIPQNPLMGTTNARGLGLKNAAGTQTLVCTIDGQSKQKLASLWQIPHITEILLSMGEPHKIQKGSFTLGTLLFKNSQIFLKSLKIYSLIHDIFHIVVVIANILNGNKYSTSGTCF